MQNQTILDDDFRVYTKEETAEIKGLKSEIQNYLNKEIKNGKITLVVLAIFSLIWIGISIFNNLSSPEILIEFIILVVCFLCLAIYSNKHPKFVFITGLSIYCFHQILYLFINPTNISKGILLKGIIIYYLFKAIQAGFEVAKKRKRLKELGVEN